LPRLVLANFTIANRIRDKRYQVAATARFDNVKCEM